MAETDVERSVPVRVLRYGVDRPLPELRVLRAGPLTAVLENADLRYVRVGSVEVVRRLYMAVRDRNWDTIEARFTSFEVDDRGDAFSVRFAAEHVSAVVDFVWSGSIEGTADGTIVCTMDGRPRKPFLRNRIGFCVLHPMDLAGTPVEVETPAGPVTGALPVRISPHQPFVDMMSIAHSVGTNGRFSVRFEGDLFEMEDQRNWTDASYKTYGTPLRIPYPVKVEPSDTIVQTVTLSYSGSSPEIDANDGAVADIQVRSRPVGRLPAIGFGIAPARKPLDERSAELIRRLRPAHLFLDLDLATDAWVDRLNAGVDQSALLGTKLELSVVAAPGDGGFDLLAEELRSAVARIARVFVFPALDAKVVFPRHDLETTESAIKAARDAFERVGIDVVLGGGTRAYFTELNRADLLPVDRLDVVTYTINPQVHAVDNLSLVETLAAQAATVESARPIAKGNPLAIGPISLRPRFNPNATGPEPAVGRDALPPSVDPRQLSLFAAGWTVGSLHRLAEAGVESVSYYETVGWRGLVERSEGLTRRSLFPSRPGQLFPLYHVFAALAATSDAEVLPVTLRDPLSCEALAVQANGSMSILVANFEDRERTMSVAVPALADTTARFLDEESVAQAASDAAYFAGAEGDTVPMTDGVLSLTLKPFAVARVAGRFDTRK